jgi:hypothetical protein
MQAPARVTVVVVAVRAVMVTRMASLIRCVPRRWAAVAPSRRRVVLRAVNPIRCARPWTSCPAGVVAAVVGVMAAAVVPVAVVAAVAQAAVAATAVVAVVVETAPAAAHAARSGAKSPQAS